MPRNYNYRACDGLVSYLFRYGHIAACVALCGGYWVLRTLRAKLLQRRAQSLNTSEITPRVNQATSTTRAETHDVVVTLVEGVVEAALASPSNLVNYYVLYKYCASYCVLYHVP